MLDQYPSLLLRRKAKCKHHGRTVQFHFITQPTMEAIATLIKVEQINLGSLESITLLIPSKFPIAIDISELREVLKEKEEKEDTNVLDTITT